MGTKPRAGLLQVEGSTCGCQPWQPPSATPKPRLPW